MSDETKTPIGTARPWARVCCAAMLACLCACGRDSARKQAEPPAPVLVPARLGRNGMIASFAPRGREIEIKTDVRIPLAGWQSVASVAQAADSRTAESNGILRCRGRVEPAPGQSYRFETATEQAGGAVVQRIQVKSDADIPIAGAFFWLELPVGSFSGGTCSIMEDGRAVHSRELPRALTENVRFLQETAKTLLFTDASGELELSVEFDRPISCTVQDGREWKNDVYSFFAAFATNPLPPGASAEIEARVALRAPNPGPATLTVNLRGTKSRFDGFGGNYCFEIEAPTTDYTLKNLNVAWARTEMTLTEWEPANDNEDPGNTDWQCLENNDGENTNLRREFLLARRIQSGGIPCCISVWRLPEWCCETPVEGQRSQGGRIRADLWPEVFECVGSYLVYAKRKYGVEPDLFSFNEPNGGGVYVQLSPEEHRDMLARLGAHLRELGLKTKLLLGDVSHPYAHDYVRAAMADKAAPADVGAVAFHSWGCAGPDTYGAWRGLADELGLPLLVAEAGVDPHAWRNRAFRSFDYGLREVKLYQDLILHARPQAVLQWEFTSDYGLVDEEKDPNTGAITLAPHHRFWFMKQFCNLTPKGSFARETASSQPDVLFTAFSRAGPAEEAYALHIANLGAERSATVSGLPRSVRGLHAVRTDAGHGYAILPDAPVRKGSAEVLLAARSLLTLTTMPVE